MADTWRTAIPIGRASRPVGTGKNVNTKQAEARVRDEPNRDYTVRRAASTQRSPRHRGDTRRHPNRPGIATGRHGEGYEHETGAGARTEITQSREQQTLRDPPNAETGAERGGAGNTTASR
eukprot:4176732-Prymnesium_polylepis.3